MITGITTLKPHLLTYRQLKALVIDYIVKYTVMNVRKGTVYKYLEGSIFTNSSINLCHTYLYRVFQEE